MASLSPSPSPAAAVSPLPTIFIADSNNDALIGGTIAGGLVVIIVGCIVTYFMVCKRLKGAKRRNAASLFQGPDGRLFSLSPGGTAYPASPSASGAHKGGFFKSGPVPQLAAPPVPSAAGAAIAVRAESPALPIPGTASSPSPSTPAAPAAPAAEAAAAPNVVLLMSPTSPAGTGIERMPNRAIYNEFT